jgi:uncharacterized protein (DUF1800 family)
MKYAPRIRWEFLALALLAAAARLPAAETWTRDDAAHLLRRAGFGGTPHQIDALHALGEPAAVEYLISGHLPPGAKPPFVYAELEPFKPAPITATTAQEANRQRQQDIQRLREWWLDRMVRTDRPLEEKMTLFWHGLLTSGAREVREVEMLAGQNALFRAEATGNYNRLIREILHDPAMLRYLNAEQNVKGAPNENLARELMELFTLGEGAGYTEKDVAEVARALTGAAIVQGRYFFRPLRHDTGPKTIFGITGPAFPDDVPNLIFQSPRPAQYLARRLWLFFAGPDPLPSDLKPIEEALLRSGYELKPALSALFTSSAFYSPRVKFAQIRSPADLLVGTIRMLDLQPTDQLLRASLTAMDGMSQVLLQPPNVRGWPGGESWITSATLYARYNAAAMLVQGGPGNPPAQPMSLLAEFTAGTGAAEFVDSAAKRFLGRPLDEAKRQALLKVIGTAPLRPGTPQTDRRLRQVIALILATPEYQLE